MFKKGDKVIRCGMPFVARKQNLHAELGTEAVVLQDQSVSLDDLYVEYVAPSGEVCTAWWDKEYCQMAKETSVYPDNNPKTAIGVTKVPLHLVPPAAKHYLAAAFADGAAKYGPYNWRDNKVSASVYIAALQRHIDAWWDGEDNASDSGQSHIAHALACLAIIADGKETGNLIDDRPTKGAASRMQKEYASISSM